MDLRLTNDLTLYVIFLHSDAAGGSNGSNASAPHRAARVRVLRVWPRSRRSQSADHEYATDRSSSRCASHFVPAPSCLRGSSSVPPEESVKDARHHVGQFRLRAFVPPDQCSQKNQRTMYATRGPSARRDESIGRPAYSRPASRLDDVEKRGRRLADLPRERRCSFRCSTDSISTASAAFYCLTPITSLAVGRS
jgi:hypothetical protein